jgi:hypothetical protein
MARAATARHSWIGAAEKSPRLSHFADNDCRYFCNIMICNDNECRPATTRYRLAGPDSVRGMTLELRIDPGTPP